MRNSFNRESTLFSGNSRTREQHHVTFDDAGSDDEEVVYAEFEDVLQSSRPRKPYQRQSIPAALSDDYSHALLSISDSSLFPNLNSTIKVFANH